MSYITGLLCELLNIILCHPVCPSPIPTHSLATPQAKVQRSGGAVVGGWERGTVSIHLSRWEALTGNHEMQAIYNIFVRLVRQNSTGLFINIVPEEKKLTR